MSESTCTITSHYHTDVDFKKYQSEVQAYIHTDVCGDISSHYRNTSINNAEVLIIAKIDHTFKGFVIIQPKFGYLDDVSEDINFLWYISLICAQRGYGKKLMIETHKQALHSKIVRIQLSSKVEKLGFYRNMGYVIGITGCADADLETQLSLFLKNKRNLSKLMRLAAQKNVFEGQLRGAFVCKHEQLNAKSLWDCSTHGILMTLLLQSEYNICTPVLKQSRRSSSFNFCHNCDNCFETSPPGEIWMECCHMDSSWNTTHPLYNACWVCSNCHPQKCSFGKIYIKQRESTTTLKCTYSCHNCQKCFTLSPPSEIWTECRHMNVKWSKSHPSFNLCWVCSSCKPNKCSGKHKLPKGLGEYYVVMAWQGYFKFLISTPSLTVPMIVKPHKNNCDDTPLLKNKWLDVRTLNPTFSIFRTHSFKVWTHTNVWPWSSMSLLVYMYRT